MPPRRPAEPPRTVKSPAVTTALRPPIISVPSIKGLGVKLLSSPFSYVPVPESAVNSRKQPVSASAAMRSRAVSLPVRYCRSTPSGPPMASAIPRRR
jgi:hypothetical protein